MVSHLFYYQLALLALIWLFVLLPRSWPRRSEPPPPVPATPLKPKRKRSLEPTAFAGLTHKPHCALCERETGETPPAPPQRPDPMPPTTRRGSSGTVGNLPDSKTIPTGDFRFRI